MIVAKLSAVSLLLASVGAAERVPRTAGAKDTTRLSVAVRDDKPDQGGYRFECVQASFLIHALQMPRV